MTSSQQECSYEEQMNSAESPTTEGQDEPLAVNNDQRKARSSFSFFRFVF